MNVLAPVSSLMTTKLITLTQKDRLTMVRDVFEKNSIHHIPVVRYKQIVGMISKTDFLHFLRGFTHNEEDRFVNEARLRAYTVEDIMTEKLAILSPTDRVNAAIEVFKVNRFHAIPVVDGEELVGIVTTHDIIKKLSEEVPTIDGYTAG